MRSRGDGQAPPQTAQGISQFEVNIFYIASETRQTPRQVPAILINGWSKVGVLSYLTTPHLWPVAVFSPLVFGDAVK
jgi:hypothetical protein